MEFLEGSDLAEWVRSRGALPVEQAIEFVLQACEAIAEAHGLGIVHRDLKPANLYCIRRADGQLSIKVLDFGISKMNDAGSSGPAIAMTRTSATMGSPLYMSPEQMQSSKDVDAQTDIWALGVILYELLSGSVPFNGETYPEVCVKVATQDPPPLRAVRPDAPAALEAVIACCLQRDRAVRYRNVMALATALAELGSPRARASVERIAGIAQVAVPAARAPSPQAPSVPLGAAAHTHTGMGRTAGTGTLGPRRRPWWAWIAAIVTAASLAVTAIAIVKKKPVAEADVSAAAPVSERPSAASVALAPAKATDLAAGETSALPLAEPSAGQASPKIEAGSEANRALAVSPVATQADGTPGSRKAHTVPPPAPPRAVPPPAPRVENVPPPATTRARNPMDLGGFQ
jgi:hypothetical protein